LNGGLSAACLRVRGGPAERVGRSVSYDGDLVTFLD
jgi:hypothetical protein